LYKISGRDCKLEIALPLVVACYLQEKTVVVAWRIIGEMSRNVAAGFSLRPHRLDTCATRTSELCPPYRAEELTGYVV
jgi:hypothetical protein